MDLKKLQEVMESRKISVNELAERAGIDRSALYRRFKAGGEKITVAEAKRIVSALSLNVEDASSIFLR